MGTNSTAGGTEHRGSQRPQSADSSQQHNVTYTYAQRFNIDAALNAPARTGEADLKLLISDQCPFTLKIVSFQGDDAASPSEHTTIQGSVLKHFQEGFRHLQEWYDTRHADAEHIHAQGEHSDAQQLRWPETALRESLLNAIEHRDYTYSGPTLINMFSTRIEIISLGGLVGNLQVNDLLNGVCQPCNPALSELFESLGWARNCGSGIPRIMDSYRNSAVGPQLRVGPSSVAMLLPTPIAVSREDRGFGSDSAMQNTTGASNDGNGDTHSARKYTFPSPTPPTTHDASVALASMRVIGSRPMQIATLGNQEYGWAVGTNAAANSESASNPPAWVMMQPPVPVRVALPPSQPLVTLEEVTLHVLSNAGVPLSRAQIQQSLGLSKNQATHLLHTLNKQGKITVEGRSRATRYSLP